MKQLAFVTGNDFKFFNAAEACKSFGIELIQQKIEIDEIQSDNSEAIARHKAEDCFKALQRPLVITDDTWQIPGLNNWPGPYMKYMNDWLTAENFLSLTKDLSDRRIFLCHYLVYQDATLQQLFTDKIEGLLLPEIRGQNDQYPSFTIASYDGGKHSAAEVMASGKSPFADRNEGWKAFASWFSQHR